MIKVSCPYCNKDARLVPGSRIYPEHSGVDKKLFWFCNNGHDAAWVGCHGTTSEPLGTLADHITRHWRKRAHEAFDPIWSDGLLTRTEAYAILQEEMNLTKAQCHIGMFDYKQCKDVIDIAGDIRTNGF